MHLSYLLHRLFQSTDNEQAGILGCAPRVSQRWAWACPEGYLPHQGHLQRLTVQAVGRGPRMEDLPSYRVGGVCVRQGVTVQGTERGSVGAAVRAGPIGSRAPSANRPCAGFKDREKQRVPAGWGAGPVGGQTRKWQRRDTQPRRCWAGMGSGRRGARCPTGGMGTRKGSHPEGTGSSMFKASVFGEAEQVWVQNGAQGRWLGARWAAGMRSRWRW